MIILKIIGWVILSVIALIILALCVKVRIFAEYSEINTHVNLKWLFIKIPLYPTAPKEKAEKPTVEKPQSVAPEEKLEIDEEVNSEPEITEVAVQETEEIKNETPKPKNNLLKTLYDAHGIDGLILIVQRVFSYIGSFIGDLMQSLVIDQLYLDVRCTKGDAASTAIYYGEVCSALFPMMGALVSKYKVRKYDINVYPDYLAKHSSASFAISLHLYPIYLIGITLLFGCRMLFKVLLRLIGKCFLPSKNKKAENSDNSGSVDPIKNK